MANQPNKTEEEVDLGSLFVIIGKGFAKFFNFIGSIFKAIFHLLIQMLIFVKKEFWKLSISTLLFGVFGFLVDFKSDQLFESEMVVKCNFNSVRQLYSNVNYFNDLVIQKETKLLQNIFNISENDAKSIKSFKIEPIENENDVINAYDRLGKNIDSLVIKKYSLEEFKRSFTSYDYNYHNITVISTKNNIFKTLENQIVNSVGDNVYFKELVNVEKLKLSKSFDLFEKNLITTDSLSKVYMYVLLEESKKQVSTGTSISLGDRNTKNPELEIFSKITSINQDLMSTLNQKVEKDNIINIVSSFQNIGNKSGGLLSTKTLTYSFFGLGLMISILLLIKLNKFLENYQK